MRCITFRVYAFFALRGFLALLVKLCFTCRASQIGKSPIYLGERLDNDPSGARYGCFLPDLTGLARRLPAPTSRASYIIPRRAWIRKTSQRSPHDAARTSRTRQVARPQVGRQGEAPRATPPPAPPHRFRNAPRTCPASARNRPVGGTLGVFCDAPSRRSDAARIRSRIGHRRHLTTTARSTARAGIMPAAARPVICSWRPAGTDHGPARPAAPSNGRGLPHAVRRGRILASTCPSAP